MTKLNESAHLLIDNRLSGGALFESATKRCAHCRRQVIMNPLRTRERNWCRKCDAYVCDNIECNLECKPFDQAIDDFVDSVALGKPAMLPHNR